MGRPGPTCGFSTVLACCLLLAAYSGTLGDQADAAGARNITAEPRRAERPEAGRKWAVLIGVDAYTDPTVPKLRYCVADVRLIKERLTASCGFPRENILVLTDDENLSRQPRLKNLTERVPAWLAKAQPGDTVLVFFSGHGMADKAGRGYLVPQDCNPDRLATSAYATADLRRLLHDCAASRKILILDCCHSGTEKAAGKPKLGLSSQELGLAFEQAHGLLTLASCRKDEKSHEWPAKRQGLFSYFLAQGLAGAADRDHNGIVDSDELYGYVFEQVKVVAAQELNVPPQTPVRIIGPDVVGVFPLARGPRPLAVRAELLVRAAGPHGALVPGAEVQLWYRRTETAAREMLGRATSDAKGQAKIDVTLSVEQQTKGEYRASVQHFGQNEATPLPNFPGTPSATVYAPRAVEQTPPPPIPVPARELTEGNELALRMGGNTEYYAKQLRQMNAPTAHHIWVVQDNIRNAGQGDPALTEFMRAMGMPNDNREASLKPIALAWDEKVVVKRGKGEAEETTYGKLFQEEVAKCFFGKKAGKYKPLLLDGQPLFGTIGTRHGPRP